MALLKALFLPGPAVPEGQLPAEQYRYSAQDVRRLSAALVSEGVSAPALGGLAVSQRAQGASRNVQVASGRAFVAGDSVPEQGHYLLQSTAVEERTIPPNPPSGSRRDLIVAEVRDGSVAGADHDWDLRVVQGTASVGAPLPETPPSSVALAVVGPITPTTGSITNALITDLRGSSRAHDAARLGGVAADGILQFGGLGAVTKGTYTPGLPLRAQAGSTVVTVNAGGGWAVPLPRPYTGVLVTVLASNGDGDYLLSLIDNNHSVNAIQGKAYRIIDGTTLPAGTPVRINWFTVGA